jgi:hypothetical protein
VAYPNPPRVRVRRSEQSLLRGGLVGIGLVALATLALAAAAALIALIIALLF